jgi:dihydrofolate reductase
MRLVVTAFVTVDGIVEAPGFDEHRSGRNAWALRVQNEEDEVYNKAQTMSAGALLLGRRTWQIWAAFWPTASGGDQEIGRAHEPHPEVRRLQHAQAGGLEQLHDHLR